MVDVTARVARMREKLDAGRAQSDGLKQRLSALRDSPAPASGYPDFSPERLDKVLSSLFQNRTAETIASRNEPAVPSGIPLLKPQEKSPVL